MIRGKREMDLDKLADLPAPALISFGVVLAIIMGVRYLGIWQGEKASPTNGPSTAQVAAVIVDPTALNRLTDQIASLNGILEDIAQTAKDKVRVDGLMANELDRIREEMRIQRELSRRN
jgi:hypothetical protein